MEGVLAIFFIFGGGAALLLAYSPVGKALAERIRHGATPAEDPVMVEELDRLRVEMNELHERMDFAERLLTQRGEPARLPGPQD